MAPRLGEPTPRLTFRPATPARWADVEALFGANGACAGCWCQWWKLSTPAFRAGTGERHRRAFRRSVVGGEVPGLIAYAGREPVGWVAVEPRARFPRLSVSRNLRVVDEQPAWSVPCFFVKRGWRRRGLAGALLAAAAAHARKAGAPVLEGYPIDSDRPMSGAFLYTGSFSTFVKAGFVEVARRARTRPVMRLELGRATPGRSRR